LIVIIAEIDWTSEITFSLGLHFFHDPRVFAGNGSFAFESASQFIPCRPLRPVLALHDQALAQQIYGFGRQALPTPLRRFGNLILQPFGNSPDQHIAHMRLLAMISLIS
jgi:hypothetical protein